MKNFVNSRAWRNNNPLNIRRGAKWRGLVTNPSDPEFCQFTHRKWGYRAAFRIMQSYFNYFMQKQRPFTIENIVSRWAPKTENNTLAYIKHVAERTGIDPDEPIGSPYTHYGRVRIAAMMGAMTLVESGCPWNYIPWDDLVEGVNHVSFVESFGAESHGLESLLHVSDIRKFLNS